MYTEHGGALPCAKPFSNDNNEGVYNASTLNYIAVEAATGFRNSVDFVFLSRATKYIKSRLRQHADPLKGKAVRDASDCSSCQVHVWTSALLVDGVSLQPSPLSLASQRRGAAAVIAARDMVVVSIDPIK